MPIYEFDCVACGHGFQRLQRLADADPSDCPECGRATIKRRLSAPSFRLAGSGWYETDFKGDKDRKRNLAGKDESGGASTGEGASKTESKPADKPAEKPAASPTPASTGSSNASPAS